MKTESTETQEKKLETLEEAVMLVLTESLFGSNDKCKRCGQTAKNSLGKVTTVGDWLYMAEHEWPLSHSIPPGSPDYDKQRKEDQDSIKKFYATLKNYNNNDPFCKDCASGIWAKIHFKGAPEEKHDPVEIVGPHTRPHGNGKFFDPRSIY